MLILSRQLLTQLKAKTNQPWRGGGQWPVLLFALINADRTLAEEVLYDKVAKVTEKISRIRMLGIVNDIANADGEFSDAEKKIVDKIRKITGKNG